MLSTDKLQVIYDEYDEKITPSDNLVDAVAKMRVAAPQSLIDTDFEYGVQGSKWESLSLTHNYPSFFSKGSGGNSLEISDATSNGGLNVRTKSRISVVTSSAHGLSNNDVISVQESLDENADGTYAVTVPLQLSLNAETTNNTFSTQSNLSHNLVANQPIIFSNVGSAVGISTGTTYYVTFEGLTSTTAYEFKLKLTLGSTSVVDVTTAETSYGIKTDNTKMFYYLAKARILSGSIKDDTLTSMVPGGIFDNAHIPGGTSGSLDRFSVLTSTGGATGILNGSTTIETPDPHGLIPGTPILINGVTSIGEQAVNNKVLQTNVATVTTSEYHNFYAGDTVLVSGVDSTFNGQYVVKSVGAITNKVAASGTATLTSAGHPFIIGDLVNVYGVDDLIDGVEIEITGIATNTFSFSSSATITSASVSGGTAIYSDKVSYDKTATNVTSTAVSPTGLIGNVGNGTTNDYATNINGSWIISSVPTPRRMTFIRSGVTKSFPTGETNSSAILICKPDAYIKHTSSNGGVELSTVNNVTGIKQIRQTRKTFRYQSGKAIQFSTGAKFTPSYDINSITSDVSSGAATISVTTVQDHGMQPGARVKVEGIQVVGGDYNPFNGDFLVTDVINQNTFAYKTTITPGFTYTTNMNPSGENSIVTVSTWAGACTRVGLFNEMNGIFFEYDGQKLWACKRSSNKPLYGTITISNKGNLVSGTETRFTKQLVAQDLVVIKGQPYQVVAVESDTQIRISPAYRGQTISTSAKIYKVQTTRIPQNEFNLDRLDGTGPSGYILDPTKMQMVYIDYTWYGSGFIRFGMRMTNGDIMYCHRMPNNNLNTQSYMRSGNLPARYEVHNYAPRTKLVAGSSTINGIPLSNDSSGATLPTTGTVMYVEDVTGWRTVAPTGVDGDVIGYAIIEKQGNSPQSEIVTYTKVGSFNTTVGGYPITIQRDKTQPLIIGGYDGSGTITTSISNATVTGVGTTDLSGIEAGDILYLANGIKLGIAQNAGVAAAGPNPSTVLLTATPPANPIPASNGSPQGYTDEEFKIVKMRDLTSGDETAQTFLPDSSIAGSLYQQLDVTSSLNSGTTLFSTGSVNLNSRVAVNTKVQIVDGGTTSLVSGATYFIASPVTTSGTSFRLTDVENGSAITLSTNGTATVLFYQPEQVSVKVITQTCAPSLTHWGSSVIMDGGYDEDRGIQFNARMKKYLNISAGASAPVMSIRIAPSVDNGIGRNFGKREVVNTMQLALKELETLGTGPFLIEGVFNPTTLEDDISATSGNYPSCWEDVNVGSGSLAQIIYHDGTGTPGSDATASGSVTGGDTIFSFYTDNSGGSNLSITRYSLESVKELGTSILSGNGSVATPGYPNGPDVLTIVVTNIGASTAKVSSRLSWTEAQA
jgi:hypothetical protein